MAEAEQLTEWDRAVLEFERVHFRRDAAKDELIRRRFRLTPVQYYQQLNALIKVPAAMAEFPVVVGRLRRLAGHVE